MHLREQLTEKGQCSSFTNAEKGNVLSRDFSELLLCVLTA